MSEEQNINGKPQDAEVAVNATDTGESVVDQAAGECTVEQNSVDVEPDHAPEAEESGAKIGDEQKIEMLAEQLAKAREDVLRAQAEARNSRRRSEADVGKARKFALEKFAGDLLPVIDNLDRALAAIDQSDAGFKSVVEGIELTRKSFLDTLAENQIVQIDPAGEPFDPETHQAMTMVPNPDLEPNTVMDVFQKGYSLNGRLIRPAMVVVSKAAD